MAKILKLPGEQSGSHLCWQQHTVHDGRECTVTDRLSYFHALSLYNFHRDGANPTQCS